MTYTPLSSLVVTGYILDTGRRTTSTDRITLEPPNIRPSLFIHLDASLDTSIVID